MKTKPAAVVVLYNPDITVIRNINSYLNFISLLIIVDNSDKANSELYNSLLADRRVKSIINNSNTGIAKALNDGIKLAIADNSEWVLTMDQDSFFQSNMIENYFEEFNELSSKDNIAVIGPIFDKDKVLKSNDKIKKVNSLITSGSLINSRIFIETGGYDEKLFIDEVDHEYCYRAQLSGYSIIQFEDIMLEHSLGKVLPVKTISGERKNKTFHSPTRLYYIVRNCCYVISKYKKKFPDEIKLKRKDLLVRIKNNLFYGNKKLETLRYVILGFLHFKMKRFGKLKNH